MRCRLPMAAALTQDLDGGESRDGNAVATPERGVEPVGHGAVNEGVVDELGGGHAGNAEHRPAAVHELSLLVPLERLLVLAWVSQRWIEYVGWRKEETRKE